MLGGGSTIHVDPRRAASHLPSHIRPSTAIPATTLASHNRQPSTTVPATTLASHTRQQSPAVPATTLPSHARPSTSVLATPLASHARSAGTIVPVTAAPVAKSRDPRTVAAESRAPNLDARAAPPTNGANNSGSVASVTSTTHPASSVSPSVTSSSIASSATLANKDHRGRIDQRHEPGAIRHLHPIAKASRDPRTVCKSGSKSSTSGRSKSKEWPTDQDQLFKPDVVTKVSGKIRIDLDSSKIKAPVNRDPRMKSRDPRTVSAEQKPESRDNKESPTSSVSATTLLSPSPKDVAEITSLPSTEKELIQSRERSLERREEIRRELKKVDRRESKREERSSSQSRKNRTVSPKLGDPGSARSRSRDPKTDPFATDKDTSFVSDALKTPTVSSPEDPCVSSSASSPSSLPVNVLLASPPQSASSSTAHDSFRSVDRLNSRRRNLRKRTTPSPEVQDSVQSGAAKQPSTEGADKDAATDSDESDHYEANKPNPAVYSDQKGKLTMFFVSAIFCAILFLPSRG